MPLARVLGLICFFTSVSGLFAKDAAVVFVVDPTWDCVESYVAHVPLLQEYKIIKVMTRRGELSGCNSDHADIYQNITYNSFTPNPSLAAEEICPQLRSLGFPVAAVIPTFDPAVALTDHLAACVGVRGNPFEGPLAHSRDNKVVETAALHKAGLRAVKETLVGTWSEGKQLLESLSPPLSHDNPVIFKITGGSSSEGVHKVYSMKQAEEIFSSTLGSENMFGLKIGHIIIQEYLHGREYVVDSVSRDGVHKVVNVWYEDLRPGNGIFNLYFGFKQMDMNDAKTKAIIGYVNKVLTATGVKNGASDVEVKWLEEEEQPCLVDLNARWTALMWHDGLALERAVTGTDQITATVNAYLDGDAFDAMPLTPLVKDHAAIIFTNVYRTGVLRGIPGMAVAEKLPSYFGSYNERAIVNNVIEKYTKGNPPITLLLAHKDKAVLDADYNRIIGLETSDAFFDISPLTWYTSLTALSSRDGGGSQGHRLSAIAVLAILAVASVAALAVRSQRNVQVDTEYLAIE